MNLRLALLSLAFLIPASLSGQTATPITIPAGTPLPVSIPDHLPLRAGEEIRAELIYPVYADNILVLPENTVVTGTVTELVPNRLRRIRSRFDGDFTPFSTPVVRFTGIVLADGTSVPIVAGTATDGAPIYRIVAKPKHKGGFIRDEFDIGMQTLHDSVHYILDPGKGDRAKLLLYSQLPYHPQRIEKGTAWTIETDAPLSIVPQPDPPASPAATGSKAVAKAVPDPAGRKSWMIQAYLRDPLTSATTKEGQHIQAIVAEPVYNDDHTIAVPQGAAILGTVTRAKPARRFGRSGNLQFDFRELVLPGGGSQNVQATIAGVDGSSARDMAINSEGKVQTKPQDKIMLPLLLAGLASRPLDQEHGSRDQLGKDAVGSNSVGLAGFIIGIAAQTPNLASGIGAYGAALSIYDRWIKRGREITFSRDTRIVLQTTPRGPSMTKSIPR